MSGAITTIINMPLYVLVTIIKATETMDTSPRTSSPHQPPTL